MRKYIPVAIMIIPTMEDKVAATATMLSSKTNTRKIILEVNSKTWFTNELRNVVVNCVTPIWWQKPYFFQLLFLGELQKRHIIFNRFDASYCQIEFWTFIDVRNRNTYNLVITSATFLGDIIGTWWIRNPDNRVSGGPHYVGFTIIHVTTRWEV